MGMHAGADVCEGYGGLQPGVFFLKFFFTPVIKPSPPLSPTTLNTQPPVKLQSSKKRDGFSEARVSLSSSIPRVSGRIGSIRCQALGDGSVNGIVYQGTYGPWTVDSSDVREVLRLHFLLLLLLLLLVLNSWISLAVCVWCFNKHVCFLAFNFSRAITG